MSTSSKVRHVLANQRHDGTHTCHWPGCTRAVAPAFWGCRRHWFTLPNILRQRIWTTYRAGQEQRKDPSQAYLEAAADVQAWIAEHQVREVRS